MALFLKSINWVPPLPQNFCLYPPRPKPSESFFVPAHVEAQRVKTRGPNPNPTTQAQSKRCLPLFTKAQNLIKILPAGLPNQMFVWYLFQDFSLLVPTRHQHGPQGCGRVRVDKSMSVIVAISGKSCQRTSAQITKSSGGLPQRLPTAHVFFHLWRDVHHCHSRFLLASAPAVFWQRSIPKYCKDVEVGMPQWLPGVTNTYM